MKRRSFLALLLAALLAGPASAAPFSGRGAAPPAPPPVHAERSSGASDNRLTEYEERRRTVAALMGAAPVWIGGEVAQTIAQGSGFLVGAGLIATNAHVVKNLGKGAVVYVLNDKLPATRARVVAQVYDHAGGKDFALLRFSPPQNSDLPVLIFNLEARRMDRVSAWGYPVMVTQFDRSTARLQKGDTQSLKAPPVVCTEGTINSVVSGKAGDALFHSASIAGGTSGGPLVNGRGEVVGINTWGYTEKGEGAFLNAALPADALAAFLAAHGVTPRLVAGQRIATRAEPARPENKPDTPDKPGKPGKGGKTGDRTRDVGSFSVEVPRGWSVAGEDKDGITLEADDHSARVAVMVIQSDDELSPRKAAQKLSKGFKGTRPETDDGETYAFDFSDAGVDYSAVVGELDDGRYFLIIMGGDVNNPGVERILDSIETHED
jgi:S1-C subfamily serine protease